MTRCKGCHKETDDETGFCLSCRHTLYTPLLIATMEFRPESFLRPMMFPVRDIIWMQDRMRLLEAQNTILEGRGRQISEIARIASTERDQERRDLAETRADVGRFEQALDAANRELAQARAERDELRADFATTDKRNSELHDALRKALADRDAARDELDAARSTIAELRGQCAAMMRESGQQAGE